MTDPQIDRRAFTEAMLAFAATITVSGADALASPDAAPAKHDMSNMPKHWFGKERIAFLIYPGFTALDMVGPHYMLSGMMGATTHIVARSADPVKSDAGLVFTPSATFDDVARAGVDILCVPGGSSGTLAAMRDDATIAFVRDVGARAKYVTSVCTGSMILGAAGLLDGYKATSHWVTKPILPVFGAIPASGRVVRDRNRVTAEGVTAGIDFGLSLVAELRDRDYAESLQLLAQYAPEPPFSAGDPETAPKATKDLVQEMFQDFVGEMRKAAIAAHKKGARL